MVSSQKKNWPLDAVCVILPVALSISLFHPYYRLLIKILRIAFIVKHFYYYIQ